VIINVHSKVAFEKNNVIFKVAIFIMDSKIFTVLLIAHVLGDIIFTSHYLALAKRKASLLKQLSGLICHGGIHFFFSGALLYIIGSQWLKGAVGVFLLHFFIDLVRCRSEGRLFGTNRVYVKRSEFFAWIFGKDKNPDKMNTRNLAPWFLINVLDQVAHVASLWGIACFIN